MKKVITLELGGEPRMLDFTREGFFEHIEDAAGIDAFEWFQRFKPKENGEANGEETKNLKTNMHEAAIIVYSGLNSYQDVNDLEFIPLVTVKRWMRSIPRVELAKTLSVLYDGFLESFIEEKKEESPNQEAPLQSGQT